MENSDQAVPTKVGLLLRKLFFFFFFFGPKHFISILALIIAALLLSWLFSLKTPGSRAGVPARKGLSPPKPISSLDQDFGWAAITPKSLYFWCCLVALKPLHVSPSSPQKPRPGKLPTRPRRQEVHGEGSEEGVFGADFRSCALSTAWTPRWPSSISHQAPSQPHTHFLAGV